MEDSDWGFLIIGIVIAALLGVVIFESMEEIKMSEERGLIELNSDNLQEWKGVYLKTSVTPIREVKSGLEIEYFIPVVISTGKSSIVILMPIFDRYHVYMTEEGIYIATDSKLELYKRIELKGRVKKNEHGEEYIFISEY